MADQNAMSIADLNLHFGAAQILHGVTLDIPQGALSIVGRNGMGKTTLCRAIMGLARLSSGTVTVFGRDITGVRSNLICRHGVGYVPQGRMVWPSLTVDEHLRVAQRPGAVHWTREKVYALFPRLAERKRNGGQQLSGGEQQMLAIGRALLTQPRLLILDEPTEGLAPVIVDHVVDTLRSLVRDDGMALLLIEQNLSVACAVSDYVAIMTNGAISETIPSTVLASDSDVQARVLGFTGRPA
jgi:ABC-type branched-subunit amino acid transport system ATPase component